MTFCDDMFDIKENLKKLPDSPGVYIHKDRLGEVIYVGKAVSLRNRVRQYFQSQKNMDSKVSAMVSHIAEFEYNHRNRNGGSDFRVQFNQEIFT